MIIHIICNKCGKYKYDLKKIEEIEYLKGNRIKFVCPICGKTVEQEYNLNLG